MTEVYPIISANCTAHHSGATPSGGLDMSTEAKAFTNLTTGTSTEAGCTEKYVGATATASLLYQKVSGTGIPAACGAQMPKGMTALSAADVTIIENWINGGAAM
jgi:hypothetical protein